jgi:hypothetical protein
VLKENKANKKASSSTLSGKNNEAGHSLETSVVGVQTIISLPVINPIKNSDIADISNAVDKKVINYALK